MSIYTLYVNSYSLKYSKIDDKTIRVSVPSYGENMDISKNKLTDSFATYLKSIGWSKYALISLENYVLFPPNGEWSNCMKLNPKNGKVYDDYNLTVYNPKTNKIKKLI